jgi:hypothetical protein
MSKYKFSRCQCPAGKPPLRPSHTASMHGADLTSLQLKEAVLPSGAQLLRMLLTTPIIDISVVLWRLPSSPAMISYNSSLSAGVLKEQNEHELWCQYGSNFMIISVPWHRTRHRSKQRLSLCEACKMTSRHFIQLKSQWCSVAKHELSCYQCNKMPMNILQFNVHRSRLDNPTFVVLETGYNKRTEQTLYCKLCVE